MTDLPRRLPPGQAKDRINPMRVCVNEAERRQIKAAAKAAGLSASSYLRAVALGNKVGSAENMKAVSELAKVNADQARLGNLLKLYLQDPDADRQTAQRILAGIEEVKAELRAAGKRIQA